MSSLIKSGESSGSYTGAKSERPPTRRSPHLRRMSVIDKVKASSSLSQKLKKSFDELTSTIDRTWLETYTEGFSGTSRERFAALDREHAWLGIQLALSQEETLIHQRELLKNNNDSYAEEKREELNRRQISTGGQLWQSLKQKRKCDDLKAADREKRSIPKAVSRLYYTWDGHLGAGRRPTTWRRNAVLWHNATPDNGSEQTWCHITGRWYSYNTTRAVSIVPFFADARHTGQLLFGDGGQELTGPRNSLLMHRSIESWFNEYMLVVVPSDAGKRSILTRWRVEIIHPSIKVDETVITGWGKAGKCLDNKELEFLSERRPAAQFLYFHFIMALVRIKDLGRSGWQTVWQRYKNERPFATPAPYLRKGILLGLSKYHGIPNVDLVEDWMKDHTFEDPHLKLSHDETKEAVRRVLGTIQEAVDRSMRIDASEESSDENNNIWDEEEEEEEEEDDYGASVISISDGGSP